MRTYLSRLGVMEWLALGVLFVILAAAIAPGLIAGFDPLRTGVARPLLPPGGEHFFGTDELGRDVFSRVVWGARVSVAISLSATLMALVAGLALGSIIAVRRDKVGAATAMMINLILVFPGVILAIALATILVPSATTTAIVLTVLYTPPISRLVAATIQSEYGKPYVASLQVAGATNHFILTRAVGRTIATVIFTFTLVILADAVLLEAALSFIGVGVQAPTPSWGNLVSGGRGLMSSGRWWVATTGGAAIISFALAVNILGDALGKRQQRLPRARAKATTVTSNTVDSTKTSDAESASKSILRVRDLVVKIPSHYADTHIVDRTNLDIKRGEVLALVGESGSGKSLIAHAILGLLPRGSVTTGSVKFDSQEILGASDKQLHFIRGERLAFLPQDSIAALNPVLKISAQMNMVAQRSDGLSPHDMLEQVRLPASRVLNAYPHELSGGQCQRIALAMALARRPDILVADEPTTALDVSVQAEIFDLLEELRRELGFSMLLITHDLALVAKVATRIAVAYGGRIVETGPAQVTLTKPRHPYTQGLLTSIRSMEHRDPELYAISGTVPNPIEFASGCRFSGRCPSELSVCATEQPVLTQINDTQYFCHNPVSSGAKDTA